MKDPFKAIRKYCLWDMRGSRNEVKNCEECDTGLEFSFCKWRMGKGKDEEV